LYDSVIAMRWIKNISITISLLLLLRVVFGQKKESINQELYWTRYYNQLTINNKWVWHHEIDNRRFFENNRQHHLILHSHLHYKFIPNADVSVGLTYSRQSPHDANSTSTLVTPEIRPFQEINLTQSLSKRLAISQRFRIDERFIHKNNGKELLDGYDFNVRLRYRLQAVVTFGDQKKRIKAFKVFDEIMINSGNNIVLNQFDQNRIYTAFEFGLTKHLSTELGYMYWHQQRNTGYQFFNRNILRFTLYHRLSISQK
jgi:Protein of unknown function (DUF2490)